jgi:hypothetical protein
MRALAVLLLACAVAPARADSFSPRDVDKQAHMSVSYGLTLTGAIVAERFDVERWQAVAIAAAATMARGTFKELVLDEQYDWNDQLANGIGTTTAPVLVLTLEL